VQLNHAPAALDNARRALDNARARGFRRSPAELDFPLARLRELQAAAAVALAPNSRGDLVPLTMGARVTLDALAAYTNRQGDTYVSVRALAREMHRSESQVSRDVGALVYAGLVERRPGPLVGDQRRRTLHLPLMAR
jgi:DNA-binding MarR family transcriptional regulator